MKRLILTGLAALLVVGLAGADTIVDRRWIKGPDSNETYNDWQAINSTLECSYGPWEMVEQADGSRAITRTKACYGNETVKLGVLPQ